MTLRDLLSGLGNKLNQGVSQVKAIPRIINPIQNSVAQKANQVGQYVRNNPAESARKALEFGAGFQGGFVKAVPGEFTEKFLNKLDIPVYNVPTKTGQMGNITGNMASTAVQGMGLGKAIAPMYSGFQKVLGRGAGQLIAKGGKAKILGQGVANLSKGLPYSASFPLLNQLSDDRPNSTKDVGGNLAFDLATGALPFVGLGGMVVGKNAKNFKNLAKITGAFDDLPRAEISDLSSRVKGNFIDVIQKLVKKGEQPVLADVMGHDSLYKSYPQLKLLKINLDPSYVAKNYGGSFDDVTNSITINPTLQRGKFRSTLLHEIQHAIQNIEGFAKGGSPAGVAEGVIDEVRRLQAEEGYLRQKIETLSYPFRLGEESYESVMKKIKPLQEKANAIQSEYRKLGNPDQYIAKYKNLAGEIEARSTQLREGMTSAQRKAINPYEQILNKEGINRNDVIVSTNSGISSLSKENPLMLKPGRPQLPTGEPVGIKPKPTVTKTQLRSRTAIPQPNFFGTEPQPITSAEKYLEDLKNNQKLLPPGGLQLPTGEPITKYVDRSKLQKPLSEQGRVLKQSPQTAYTLWKQSEDRIAHSSIFDDGYIKQLLDNAKIIKSNPEIGNINATNNALKILPKNTPVKVKVGILDYLRTPDRVLKKIGLESNADELRKAGEKYTKELPEEINKITQWYKQAPSPESAVSIFKWLDGQNVELNPKQLEVANKIKIYLSEWADKLELPKDKRITNYITHIFDDQLVQKEFDDDLAKLIQDKVAGSVYDPFTQQRLGKLGYKENVWDALDAYVKRAVRKYNMDPALEKVKKASENLESSQFDYVKSLVDRINMRPTKIDNLIDNTIKQIFGYKFTARPTAYLSRKVRQWVYRGTLGLNVGSALRNLTQGVNTYAKLGEKYTILGYTKLLTNGTDELKREGILADDIIQDRSINVAKKSLEKMDKGLFYMFELAEKINRGPAYFGAKAQALSKGLSEEQAIEYAKKIVRDTQFTFGKVDTPVLLQSDIAKTVAQFQSYNLKQTEFLAEMIKNKEYAGIARYAIGSIVVVSTIGELLGLDIADMIPSFSFRGGLPPILSIPNEAVKPWITGKDKYGNELDTKEKVDSTVKSLTPLVPGGVQIKKTIEGLTDVSKGYSESASGRVKYPIKQSADRYIRGALFGRWNLPEAQEYLKEKRSVLGEGQSKLFKQAQDKEGLYNSMIENRKIKAEETKLKDQVKKSGQPQATDQSIMYLDGDSVKTVKTNITFPKLTSSNELNKKLISEYKGDVTDYANYVMYMYKSGKMTAEQAGAVLERLRKMTDMATKSTKTSKPKTVSMASLARQTLKPVKVQKSTSSNRNTFSILDDYAKLKAKTPVFKLPVLKKEK